MLLLPALKHAGCAAEKNQKNIYRYSRRPFSGDVPIYSAATKGFRRLNIAIRIKACGARQRGRGMRKERVRENLKGEGETGAQRRLPLFLRVVPHISRPAASSARRRFPSAESTNSLPIYHTVRREAPSVRLLRPINIDIQGIFNFQGSKAHPVFGRAAPAGDSLRLNQPMLSQFTIPHSARRLL